MNLLIVAATAAEISPVIRHLEPYRVAAHPESYKKGSLSIRLCLTGVGSTQATYAVTKAFASGPCDMAIQAGIAGSFSRTLSPGDVLRVQAEWFADLGAEDQDTFLDLFDLGLQDKDAPPFRQGALVAPLPEHAVLSALPSGNAVTVNTVSGRARTIERLVSQYHPVLESMEGAAFHYVCLQENVKFAQLRSVSNYVEVRDKSRWDIPLAVERLNALMIRYLEAF